jgi:hypothetical protein
MSIIEDYLLSIEQTSKRKERIQLLGDLFTETHVNANDVDKQTMFSRIVRLLKINYNDYYELAKTIYETKHLNGEGNHWNYITAVMRNKKKGNIRER